MVQGSMLLFIVYHCILFIYNFVDLTSNKKLESQISSLCIFIFTSHLFGSERLLGGYSHNNTKYISLLTDVNCSAVGPNVTWFKFKLRE